MVLSIFAWTFLISLGLILFIIVKEGKSWGSLELGCLIAFFANAAVIVLIRGLSPTLERREMGLVYRGLFTTRILPFHEIVGLRSAGGRRHSVYTFLTSEGPPLSLWVFDADPDPQGPFVRLIKDVRSMTA